MPDGHVAEEGDVECGGDVEDVVRDHHLRACDDNLIRKDVCKLGCVNFRLYHMARRRDSRNLEAELYVENV